MARIRSIHPGLFTDEAFMELSMAARVLLPGLWVEAWDDGVIEWRTKRIKARLFPCDNIDVDALLAELVSQDMIRKFEAGGMKYAAIKNFRKWQRPEKPNSSNVLPKDLEDYVQLHYRAVDKLPKQNADPAVSRQQIDNKSPTGIPPLDDNSTTGSGNVRQKGGREEGRMEEESSLRSLSPREALAASDKPTQGESDEKIHQISEVRAFAQFWEAYPAPARSAPDYARKAYRRALKRGATPELILAALRREKWRDDPRYIPKPERWLEGGSWRLAAADPAPIAAPPRAAGNDSFAGWETADHLALGEWQSAEASGEWLTRDPRRNALPVAERRADLLDTIQRRSPRAARHIADREVAEQVAV